MKSFHTRTLSSLIIAGLLMQMPGFLAIAQAEVFDAPAPNLFDDELDSPVGSFQQNSPPPAPPVDFGNNGGANGFAPPASFPGDTSAPPFGDSGLSTTGGRGGMTSGTGVASGKSIVVKSPAKADPNKPKLADAQIEDITNANYGDLIESFDYPNADISDLVKAISQLTGKNFIIDPGVRGKISIVAPTQITVAEAYKAFLSALAINGFTVVPSGKFLKIKSARNAQRDSIETYSGAYYPTSDVMITRIIHLKHISAEEVNKRLRALASKDGDMITYEPTNTIIFTDYGTNIDRTMKIINELDKPGFEEQLAVMPIRYAKAKDLADLINQIINKDPSKKSGANQFGGNPGFGAAVPSFRSRGGSANGGTPEELSIVTPDDRTNAIIVVGNKAGIEKVRDLVRKLDYKLDPAEAGGVFVYYVKFGEAEKIAQTLNGVTTGTAAAGAGGAAAGGFGGGFGGGFAPMRSTSPSAQQSIFGGDVKIIADKNTNSLVITASKQDYDVVKNLLASLDIPKDQVFVEAIIMEMNTQKARNWNPTYYHLDSASNGIGRIGFSTPDNSLAGILNPIGDSGAVLGFPLGAVNSLVLNGQTYQVPSLLAFIKVIQSNVESNILSTPRILALDNETASIEVGDKIPIGNDVSTATNGTTTNAPKFEDASIKLEITPFIRPDSEMVRMKIDQIVKQKSNVKVESSLLANSTTVISNREIKTNLVVKNGDTAVLGGLVRDQESVSEQKIPLLGDIPVLGWLFKSKSISKDKINLVVFMTPKIIRSNVKDGHEVLNRITNERIDWLKKNFDGRDPYGKKIDDLPRAAAADQDVQDDEPIARRQPQSVSPTSPNNHSVKPIRKKR